MGNKQLTPVKHVKEEIQDFPNQSLNRNSAESDIEDEESPISQETNHELCHAQIPLPIIVSRNIPESKFEFEVIRPCEVRITGIVSLESDRILLCNNKGEMILVYNSSGKFLQEVTLLSNPFDIAVLSDKMTAVVSFQGEKYIQSVILSPTYVLSGDQIGIKSPCTGGISAFGDDMAVGIKRGIEIYSCHGQFVKSIESEVENISYLKYANEHLTYSNGIYFIRQNNEGGKTELNFTGGREQIGLLGIALFPNGDGFIAEYGTDLILKFTSGIQNTQTELRHEDGIYGPRCLCFNSNFSKLFIVNNDGQSVYIHLLKKS